MGGDPFAVLKLKINLLTFLAPVCRMGGDPIAVKPAKLPAPQ